MNTKYCFDLTLKHIPDVPLINKEGWLRHHVVNELHGNNNIGIELGVARGIYSKRMIDSGKFNKFYGVDVYGDMHNTQEYKRALQYIGFTDNNYCLLRMEFGSAYDLFDDEYFDFIYLDGFAHTGEEGGKTLIQWYNKLKIGGIIAGDDYHDDWPLVRWAVNDFAQQVGEAVHVTRGYEEKAFCQYPTWYMVKPNRFVDLAVNQLLYNTAMKEKVRIHRLRSSRLYHIRRKLRSLVLRLVKFVFG